MALTKSDKVWIANLFDSKAGSKMAELEEKFEKMLIEFKSDLYEKIDPILKEVTTAREERPLIENRLEKLEEIHQTGKHALAS
jgi:tryptophanyl-tRNA synthetase